MRVKLTVVLALVVTLSLTDLATSETISEYISFVEIYVDGLTDTTGVRILTDTLMKEDGVAEISHDLEEGIIIVKPSQDVGWVNLFDFVQRVNGTRQYTVSKMDVIAVGRLVKFPVDYEGEVYDYGGAPYDGAYDYVADRYAFQVGDNYFLLAKDDTLNGMISSGYESARVLGTVKTFSAGVPIMRIRDFQKPNDLEELSAPKEVQPFESRTISSETTQDRISWVRIQVDGMNCAICVRRVESALAGERGVASVTADLETGTVVVIPETDGDQIKLVNLISRINGTREYIATEMTVVAEGRAVRLPVKYHEPDLHTHSHDRYKLQVGNTHFILSDNEKLHELLESGQERIRAAGTVSAFNDRVPIMAIGVFEEPGDRPGAFEYARSSDADTQLTVKEEKLAEKKDGHARVESIRV
jgi:copper chaperone CopZ